MNSRQICADLQSLPLEYKVSRRRKTLGLKVSPGRIIVSYPSSMSKTEVISWVNNKRGWIIKHYRPALAQVNESAYRDSDTLFWNGQNKTLVSLVKEYAILPDGFFRLSLVEQKHALLSLCAQQIAQDLRPRVLHWESILSLHSKTMKFRPYKSRWGSCTHRGEVAFNTLLMMAPPWVRDYVVIHELCHLKHLNHSKFFWAEVAQACSALQIKKAKAWLRLNGNHLLSIYR